MSPSHAAEMWRQMTRIRRFEEKCAELYSAGDIRGAMIVAAGLIEGVTFFALIVTILLAIK